MIIRREKILWEYKERLCHISVPCAIDAGNNKVLVVGGYEYGAAMISALSSYTNNDIC